MSHGNRQPIWWTTLTPLLLTLTIVALSEERAGAGTFLGADESFPGTVTHPPNYDPTVGGVVTVRVCIDPAAANAAAMEIPVQNVVRVINDLVPVSPNLVLGAGNNVPVGDIDFESLTLHELGHCLGLGHPNLGIQTGVSGSNTEFTQSGDGANGVFSFSETPPVDSDGADNVIGSSDDNRSDDVNFHWFVDGVNNPFAAPPAIIDQANYARSVGDLPAGHTFPANAGRDVGTLLGFANTEAVMQQGQGSDEDQRALQNDDVATLRFAMSGLDEVSGTSDDYTINMVYAGMTTSCDIVVRSELTGFGVCRVNLKLTDPALVNQDHLTITSAEFAYNSSRSDWFFNQVDTTCAAATDDLPVSGTDAGVVSYAACNSISFSNYTSTGTVTATAPSVILGENVTIGGTFTADSSVP